ncbi:hypothetical protein [Mycobacterium asiaticum]|uniref:Uncharacterized protein n=1 Tax=Mycobacterium asiaticum TaxID=1790 RepID=A0A1A3N8N5_MYCAS|nr:hypothetical protein [Mycobacterium asiaticum]OBK18513.1 hypothetical protein A5636_20735 [Mycobacterium asiaticum]
MKTYETRWHENAARRAVAPEVIVEIAGQHGIDATAFGLLDRFEEITDSHGKSFFLVPPGTGGNDVRRAVLLTYVLNAGTDYGKAGERAGVINDFAEVAYCPDEVRRIAQRQRANSWSYQRDVRFVHRNGGRLMTTPNGILLGAGGNWLQRLFSQRGGTTWGDIFMLNTAPGVDPAATLRGIVQSGDGDLALDRLLHHEERHSAQWAALGYAGMLRSYSWELFRELVFHKPNRLEVQAGLRDGGYR